MKRGLFITFEGGEGTGKTTQIGRLARWLRRQGCQVTVTREPGGTPLANRIRLILLNPKNRGMHPFIELSLYLAARKDHVSRLIRPALAQGKIVLCDRFSEATFAYQGYGRKIPLPLVRSLDRAATQGLKPTLTFLFDLPASVGLKRALIRTRADRLHHEAAAFHRRVRNGYLTLARLEKRRFRKINAALPRDKVFEAIQKEMFKLKCIPLY